MIARSAVATRDRLGERDYLILGELERFRLLSTEHLRRLHFAQHGSQLAGARACNRALQRLRELGVIASLDRRVGGVRKGSASYVWQLAAPGERLLRAERGEPRRRRFVEPSRYFAEHTLAVASVAVGIEERSREQTTLTIENLQTEPANWRRYLGGSGQTQWLKPDLYVVTGHGGNGNDSGYEDHRFIEVDLGTEHLPRIRAKCQAYAAYARTGAYQAAYGLFPAVVWLSPDPARRAALRAAVAATPGLPAGLFRVQSPAEFERGLTSEEPH